MGWGGSSGGYSDVSRDLKEVRTRGLSAISVPSRGTVSVKATVAGQAGQEKER